MILGFRTSGGCQCTQKTYEDLTLQSQCFNEANVFHKGPSPAPRCSSTALGGKPFQKMC